MNVTENENSFNAQGHTKSLEKAQEQYVEAAMKGVNWAKKVRAQNPDAEVELLTDRVPHLMGQGYAWSFSYHVVEE